MNKKLAAKIQLLPQKPGAYLFKGPAGQILYVGKAIKLKNRVRSHFVKNNGVFKGDLIKNTADIDFILATDEKEALILENELIKKYKPKYNIQWRDDKSYFWVSFTADEWPRVQITHKRSAIGHRLSAISQLLGPFTNGTELKQVLRALRKILPYRTCKNPYDKPCLQWHLGLCPAHKSINSKQSTINNGSPLYTYRSSLNTLRQFLRLYANEPIKIEAYDISNIQGANATGSMVVFKGFKRDRSQYRKFKIKTVRGANDVAMLKEIIRRRLNHNEWPLPDLMLIDGGQAQLNAANLAHSEWRIADSRSKPDAISQSPLAIISLAKRDEELYTIYSNRVLRLSTLPVDLRLLFQAIRDEAHRFAISYYRKLHRKKTTTHSSSLRAKRSNPVDTAE